MNQLKNITLELSLKPFRRTDSEGIRAVCLELFHQWKDLSETAEMISVMLWAADGSEILDYTGNLEECFEWAKFIGGANRRTDWNRKLDPDGLGLHTTRYLYTDNPPVFTYGILKEINETLKKIGHQVTGKPIRVGATFDPGPEFAISPFKYQRHPEILKGDTMGRASFVCCYHILSGDSHPYGAYPAGIPEGTPFGTFFGKQSQLFLRDLCFDYIWFSNGLGFGSETWGTTGATFDGTSFFPEKLDDTQQRILDFWALFRKECSFPIETRGTNLSMGIDLASDAVNLKKLYDGDFDFLPPPNSPWAALDGDFGLELAGYMSRVADLPSKEDYLFRFYVHDPWWMNSPWIDRYEGEPHDIFLPMAVSRINKLGQAAMPSHLNILTVDNSLGEMPDFVPREVTAHLLRAFSQAPDQAGPFVWLYPFAEYAASTRIEKPFFEDWLVRGAINHGLPLNTVLSTEQFTQLGRENLQVLKGSVLVTSMPPEDSAVVPALLDFVQGGGRVLLYGAVEGASPEILKVLELAAAEPISGELRLSCPLADREGDLTADGTPAACILHDPLLSDGGIRAVAASETPRHQVLATVSAPTGETRLFALETMFGAGKLLWIRGSNGSRMSSGSHILQPYTPEEAFPQETLFRLLSRRYGWDIRFLSPTPSCKTPITLVHRHENGFFFSVYSPNTTVETRLTAPYGAPLLLANETALKDGAASYHFGRAQCRECRVFVKQNSGVVGCKEIAPVSFQARRRLEVSGLVDATVTVFPKTGLEDHTTLLLNSRHPHMVGDSIVVKKEVLPEGVCLTAEHLNGTLIVSDILAEGKPDREFDE